MRAPVAFFQPCAGFVREGGFGKGHARKTREVAPRRHPRFAARLLPATQKREERPAPALRKTVPAQGASIHGKVGILAAMQRTWPTPKAPAALFLSDAFMHRFDGQTRQDFSLPE